MKFGNFPLNTGIASQFMQRSSNPASLANLPLLPCSPPVSISYATKLEARARCGRYGLGRAKTTHWQPTPPLLLQGCPQVVIETFECRTFHLLSCTMWSCRTVQSLGCAPEIALQGRSRQASQ